jgi:hypothetical protein
LKVDPDAGEKVTFDGAISVKPAKLRTGSTVLAVLSAVWIVDFFLFVISIDLELRTSAVSESGAPISPEATCSQTPSLSVSLVSAFKPSRLHRLI